MAETTRRRIAIGTRDPVWGAAVAAALAGADIDVVAITTQPEQIPSVGIPAAVLCFDAATLRQAVDLVDPSTAILALGPDDMDLMLDLLEAGVLGYLFDDAPFDEIVGAVGQVLDGHAVVPPAALGTLLRRIVDRRRSRSVADEAIESLTQREREVFEQMARGRDNETIANNLFISPATARTHLQRVFKKLGVHTRAEAVAYAARCGIIAEGDSHD